MIKFIQSQRKRNLVGVEVGVSVGENAENILRKIDIKRLYLVDSYDTKINVKFEENMRLAFKRMKKYGDKIEFIITDSVNGSFKIPEKVDFVYIDGDHSYPGVTRDIQAYYPIVKKGGVIGGHDFEGTFLSVVTAVLDWTRKNGLELFTENFDWWVIKK